jgi:hypothetical protein
MGWFKKMVSEVSKATDKLMPESVKKASDKFLSEDVKLALGGMGDLSLGKLPDPVKELELPAVDKITGRLTTDEMDEAAKKRLARVGKYFTSVLGDTSKVNAGSQKVFS